MSERIANINLMHQASLAGMEAIICQALGIEKYDYHDDIIYSAMIQAGVQRFRVAGPLPPKLCKSSFLSHKIEERPFEEIRNLMSSIEETLKNNASSYVTDSDLFTLTWFLTDLIYSLQTKSSMVSILPTPNIVDYADKLSPDVLSAIGGLFKKIENIEIDLPVTQMQVPSKDVELFREVISSDIFGNYAESQGLLEFSSEDKDSTSQNIMEKGKSLYNKFSSTLDIRKASLSLIPVTSSLIDTVCGKLPGKVANTLGNALSSALNEKRRITIYNYGDTHQKLLIDYYSARSNKQ